MKAKRPLSLLAMTGLYLSFMLLQSCATAEIGKTKFSELNTGMSGPVMSVLHVEGAVGDILSVRWKNYYSTDGEIIHLALMEFFIKYHKQGHIRRQAVNLFSFDKSSDHLLTSKRWMLKRVTGQPLLENLSTKDEIIKTLGEPQKILYGETEDQKEIKTDWWSGIKEIWGKLIGDEILYYERDNGKEVMLVLIDEKTNLIKGVLRLAAEPLKKDPEGYEISTSGAPIGVWESPVTYSGGWLRRKIQGDNRYFESLVKWTKEESELSQRYAIELISELNDQASFDYLITTLANKDNKYLGASSAAATALGQKRNPKAVAPLLETLKDCGNLMLCQNTVWALKSIDEPSSIEPLMLIFRERKRWPKLDEQIAITLNSMTRQVPSRNYKEWLEWLGKRGEVK